MNIVDSSEWIEYIADAANADFFKPALLDPENLLVPTICLYEVFKRVLQDFGDGTRNGRDWNHVAGSDY